MPTLFVDNLKVAIGKKTVLNGVNLKIKPGEIHALMGPNGSGKSTLACALLNHPLCRIRGGAAVFGKLKLNRLSTDRIARAGILLANQQPQEIPGVSVLNLLNTIAKSRPAGVKKIGNSGFSEKIKKSAEGLRLSPELLYRGLNEGFSGGEKKKMEILQLFILSPKLLILDEIDSGLDIDALKLVAGKIAKMQKGGAAALIITHYQRILKYVKPDYVHVMAGGKIIRSGKAELARQIEKFGFEKFLYERKCPPGQPASSPDRKA